MKKLLFWSILILAFLWRIIGIYPGYPLHADEGMSYSQGMAMITEKTLDAHGYAYAYAYPNLVPIINALFFKLFFIPLSWFWFFLNRIPELIDGVLQIIPSQLERERIFQVFILGKGGINPLYWGRYVASFFGFGSVILSYILGKKIFSKNVGLIWAFFMAASWRLVLASHLDLPDIYNVFFLILSMIFSLNIKDKPTIKNYLFAGLFAGLSFNVKFQTFSIIIIGICYLYSVFIQKRLNLPFILISVFSFLLITLIMNPYHLIHWKTTYEQISYVAMKYGMGKKNLYIYPIFYLYYYAVGVPAVWASFLGIIYVIFKKKYFYLILILSPILSGLYLFAYYSGGGFYTRNLLTISTFVLLFSALGVNFIFEILEKIIKNKLFLVGITIPLILLLYFDQIMASTLVVLNYKETWNIHILESWLSKNIPTGAKIAAHSNVPLPIKDVVRLDFEDGISFSIDEFRENGASYAIANFAWATNSFYWWMGGIPQKYQLNYFNKPVDLLEFTYQGIALRELSESAIYLISNSWQAPDTTFVVAKIPEYNLIDKSEIIYYDFQKGTNGWKKSGIAWEDSDNLSWATEGLLLEAEPVLLPSTRWESPVHKIEDAKGFYVEYKVNSISDTKNIKGAYIFVSFYKNLEDAQQSVNRVSVRLSERKDADSIWEIKNLMGLIPDNAKYMTIGYSSYDNVKTRNILSWLKIYKSDIEVDYGKEKIKPVMLDINDLFPNSHGNL